MRCLVWLVLLVVVLVFHTFFLKLFGFVFMTGLAFEHGLRRNGRSKVKRFALMLACLCLASCDDDEDGQLVQLLGGGPGSDSSQGAYAQASPIPNAVAGQSFTTLSSEFGFVDDPKNGGNGDPGTSGNFFTGADGSYIAGKDSTGVSLPLSTEIAFYGSEHAAVARGVGVDLLYQTARDIGAPVNGSAHVLVQPLTSQSFK